jgi:hypothetical protein
VDDNQRAEKILKLQKDIENGSRHAARLQGTLDAAQATVDEIEAELRAEGFDPESDLGALLDVREADVREQMRQVGEDLAGVQARAML